MVIKLMCGLGNQMFQYAYGRAMQKNGYNVQYNLDWYIGYNDSYGTKRDFLLDKFNVNMKFTSAKADQVGTNGLWEISAYADLVPELKNELIIKKELYTNEFLELWNKIDTGVHVRRGDLANLDYVNNINIGYYHKAIDHFKGKVFIFSDDIEWCKTVFTGVEFVDIEDYLCFELFRNCPNKIICNSTFSWWGAYLGGGNVIAPAAGKYKEGSGMENITLDKINWKLL